VQFGEQQRANIHEGQHVPVYLPNVEQVQILLDLVQLKANLDLAAQGHAAIL
jgi:hypothetical protein